MRIKKLSLGLLFLTIIACGSKTVKSSDAVLKDTKAIVEKINSNTQLEASVVEGVLTDASGTKDTGHFKYSVYFDAQTKILNRIKNVETTQKTVTENFYFKNNKLVFISVEAEGETKKEAYIVNGNVINETSIDADYLKILLNKAKMFQKEFKKSH